MKCKLCQNTTVLRVLALAALWVVNHALDKMEDRVLVLEDENNEIAEAWADAEERALQAEQRADDLERRLIDVTPVAAERDDLEANDQAPDVDDLAAPDLAVFGQADAAVSVYRSITETDQGNGVHHPGVPLQEADGAAHLVLRQLAPEDMTE